MRCGNRIGWVAGDETNLDVFADLDSTHLE